VAKSEDSYFIPSSYSRIVARELALQERDLPRLLQGTGLSPDILQPGDETFLTGRQQLRILDNAQRMLGVPDFGLRLGSRLNPTAHGPLGYLALSSPDLITSLESLREFLPARLPMVRLDVAPEGEWLCCSLTIRLDANLEEQRVLQECFALVIQSFVETVLGRELTDARIELAHRRPDYHALYRQYLHSPVRFAQPATVFRLPASLARVPNAAGDPESYALARDLCRKLLEQVPAASLSCADRVRRVLLSQTPGSVTESEVARAMFISKRTLARRLEAEGSSYRLIRDQLLAQLASSQLRESALSVEAVAALLGYNDTAAFRKAFRRWYGQAPGEFRSLPRSSPPTGTGLAKAQ
jgi:AraC-like DNA-binding protein